MEFAVDDWFEELTAANPLAVEPVYVPEVFG
jgi:hypothetical protein